MRKLHLGILLGIGAGILDITPMLIKKLPLEALISSFIFWIITGFIIGTSALKIKGVWKGTIIAALLILPLLVIIGRNDQDELIPIFVMTIILGGLVGFLVTKYGK